LSNTALLRVLEHVHGHLGVLAAAALWHPAILLRNLRRRAPLSAALATTLISVAAAPGFYLYPSYRSSLKQRLFLHAPRIGWLFERKEHLAVGALALAWTGLIAHLLLSRQLPGTVNASLARTAHLAYVGAAVLSTVVVIIGVTVAVNAPF
jgi:hypothetical protein